MTRKAKQRKRSDYVIRDERNIYLQFYQRYDYKFLYNKAMTLLHIVTEKERFKEHIKDFEQRNEEPEKNYLISDEIDEKYFEALRAEVYFTEMHLFESFFALLIAAFEEIADWLYLTEYTPWEIKEAVHLYLDGKIEDLTRGQSINEHDFLMIAVYAGNRPDVEDEGERNKWNENLENISWLLHKLARKYVDALEEYNSYKHGVRVMTGPTSLAMTLNDEAGNSKGPSFLIGASDDSLIFLDLEDTGEGGKTVFEKTKHFNTEESFLHLALMRNLLEIIQETRLAWVKNEKVKELPTVNFLDKEKLLTLKAKSGTSWRFSM